MDVQEVLKGLLSTLISLVIFIVFAIVYFIVLLFVISFAADVVFDVGVSTNYAVIGATLLTAATLIGGGSLKFFVSE
jgi:hypothetical protein